MSTTQSNPPSQMAKVDRVFNPLAPVGNAGTMKTLMNSMQAQIAEILPKHVRVERIMKSALVAINRQPKLLECTQQSVMKSIMEASELGLDPSGGTLGQGYLVPFNNKVKDGNGREQWLLQATFIPGYRGLCDLARRGGEVRRIESHVVYRGDEFDYEMGTNSKLKHIRRDENELDKDISHGYAIAWLSQEDYQFEVMTRKQIDKIRERSKSKNNGPWVTDFAEMCRKTLIRRLIKYLPISSERLARAVELSDDNEFGTVIAGQLVDSANRATPQLPPQTAGDQLASRIMGDDGGQTIDTSDAQDAPGDDQLQQGGDDGQQVDGGSGQQGGDEPPKEAKGNGPAVDFVDYGNFYEACTTAAVDVGMPGPEFEKQVKAWLVESGKVGKPAETTTRARMKFYQSIKDWKPKV